MDELSAHIQEEVPWCMLIVDDGVLVDELKDCINVKLERQRETLARASKLAYKDEIFELQL